MKKRLRPYLNFLEDSGLRVLDITITGSTHRKIAVTSKGKNRFFVVPSSTSDRRSFENWKSDVRRWVREIHGERTKL
jgi:hypothetical protein